jgi:hypothetical protein
MVEISDGSHAFTTHGNGWQSLPLHIAQRRLAKLMVIQLSCYPKYLHHKIQILTQTLNLGGPLRRHRGWNRRRAVARNTSRVCRSACASNTSTPSSVAEQSEEGLSEQNPTRGGASASQARNGIMQSAKPFVSSQNGETEGSPRNIWSQVSVETEEASLILHIPIGKSASNNGGLFMLFLVLQQRSNNGVLYEAFKLMIWSSTHVRHTIKRVGVDCIIAMPP